MDTWQQAEANAQNWMRYWGYSDASVTGPGCDGGIDVRSSRALAQVKFQSANVSRPDLQRLVGARGQRYDLQLLMFAKAWYSRDALIYADEMNIALFHYEGDGSMMPMNAAAEQISHTSAGAPPRSAMGAYPGEVRRPRSGRARKWRIGFAVLFLIAPFAGLQNEENYAGPWYADIGQFVFHFTVCWLIGLTLLAWGSRRR